MIRIYSRPQIEKSYYSPLFSFTTVLASGFLVGLLLIPFAIAYVSGPFWMKTNSYREQPKVLLEQNVFGIFEGLTNNAAPLQIIYSSDPSVTQQLDTIPRVTTLKTFNVDRNEDGIMDYFWLNLSVPVTSYEAINHVRVAFSLQVSLSSRIRMVAPAMGIVDIASPLVGSGVYSDGFLKLVQTDLMTDHMDYYDGNPIFDYNYFFGADINAISWPRIISNYHDRPFQPVFDSIDLWQFPQGNDGSFHISIKVRVPVWDVEYRPAIMEVLKNGWIQYITTFIFTGAILFCAWDYLVSNQIIKSVAYLNVKARGSKTMY